MRRLVVILASTMALVAGPLRAADWPRFLGPNGTGISPEKGINKNWKVKPPRVLWQVPLGDNGFAGPAVAGGRVYIVDHEGENDVVRALSLATGKEAWRFSYRDTARENYGFARATPTVIGGAVYTLSRLGLLHCLDAATGKKKWAVDIIQTFNGKRPEWDI
ncbi:MAG: PQQ-binding-like beta-propeller repeat protein, partial [Armatimonadota bacterium]|nr:PQQ-binding-like beta-propeller repeat protein [Armatimonadota bacterium]